MRSAAGTFPLSYSETLQSSRTADASALRTGLGSPSFVGFDVYRLPSGSLVSQHRPERTPPGVVDGLCHLRPAESGCVHIADDDQSVFSGNPRRLLMKIVTAGVGDLSSDRSRPLSAAGSLRPGKRRLALSVVTQRRDFLSGAQRRERGKAKVDADLVVACRKVISDFALEADVPASTGILHEAPGPELALGLAVPPEAVAPLQVDRSVAVNPDGAGDERRPSECALGAEARTKARAFPVLVARLGELSAYRAHCIGVQPEVGGSASAEFDQVECSWPPAVQAGAASALGFPLGGAAKVPDLIGRNSKPAEVLPGSSVLDAELEGKDAHGGPLAASISLRSRSRGAVARSAASPFLAQQSYPFNFRSNQGARFLRRLNPTVSAREI